jgi:hypothetical protein
MYCMTCILYRCTLDKLIDPSMCLCQGAGGPCGWDLRKTGHEQVLYKDHRLHLQFRSEPPTKFRTNQCCGVDATPALVKNLWCGFGSGSYPSHIFYKKLIIHLQYVEHQVSFRLHPKWCGSLLLRLRHCNTGTNTVPKIRLEFRKKTWRSHVRCAMKLCIFLLTLPA